MKEDQVRIAQGKRYTVLNKLAWAPRLLANLLKVMSATLLTLQALWVEVLTIALLVVWITIIYTYYIMTIAEKCR